MLLALLGGCKVKKYMPTFLCTSCGYEYDGPGMCESCDIELVPGDEAEDSIDALAREEDRGFDSFDDDDGI